MPALFRYIAHRDTAKCPPYPLKNPSYARAEERPSVLQGKKEDRRTLPPIRTENKKCPKNMMRKADRQRAHAPKNHETRRLTGLSLFAEKSYPQEKGADGASNLFHTTP